MCLWTGDVPDYEVFAGTHFQMTDIDVLCPDVSVLRTERASVLDPEQPAVGAPLLAVEVVSSDEAALLHYKVGLYLRHGTAEVWVVYRDCIYFHRPESLLILDQSRTLRSTVLPSFDVPVSRLLASPEPA